MVQPSICKCCGGSLPELKSSRDCHLTICDSCLRLVEDVQDSMVIESAIPYEPEETVVLEDVDEKGIATPQQSDLASPKAKGK